MFLRTAALRCSITTMFLLYCGSRAAKHWNEPNDLISWENALEETNHNNIRYSSEHSLMRLSAENGWLGAILPNKLTMYMGARDVSTVTSQEAGGWPGCAVDCRLLLLLFLLSLFLDPEDGTDKFLRNFSSLPKYTALKFRRSYCIYYRENLKSNTFSICVIIYMNNIYFGQ
jgi:hypothetical protein